MLRLSRWWGFSDVDQLFYSFKIMEKSMSDLTENLDLTAIGDAVSKELIRQRVGKRLELSDGEEVTPVHHGIDCKKVKHIGDGYLHLSDDDGPYDVDGMVYCGRCHECLGTISRSAQRRVRLPNAR